MNKEMGSPEQVLKTIGKPNGIPEFNVNLML